MAARKRNENNLTPCQQAFTDFWLEDPNHNGTEAYKKAFKTCKKDSTAKVNASKLLTNTNVDAYIKKRQKEMAEIAHATQDRVILEERRIAFLDIRGLFKEDGSLVSPTQLPEDLARAVAGLEVTETEIAGVKTTKYKYKFSDKGRALERLSKFLGLYELDNQQRGITFDQLLGVLKSLDPVFAERVCAELAGNLSS